MANGEYTRQSLPGIFDIQFKKFLCKTYMKND